MKKNFLRLGALVLATSLFLGCQETGKKSENTEPKKEVKVLAEVHGKKITTEDLEKELKNMPPQYASLMTSERGIKELVESLATREAILLQATKDGIEKDKEYKEQLEEAKKKLLTNIYVKKKVESAKPTEEEIKEVYEKQFASGQVHASHILVATEAEAKQVLAKLKSGADFTEVAKQKSKDPTVDLGWFGKGIMTPEFEKAAFAMEPGQLSGIVKTQFGFHIIKLAEKKTPKSVDEVRDQIIKALKPKKQQQEFVKMVTDFKKDIKLNDENIKAVVKSEPQKAEPQTPELPKPAKK